MGYRVLFRVAKSRIRKLGNPGTANIAIIIKIEKANYRYIFVVQGLLNFLARDLATLKNALSISDSLCPLAAGPIRYSLYRIGYTKCRIGYTKCRNHGIPPNYRFGTNQRKQFQNEYTIWIMLYHFVFVRI